MYCYVIFGESEDKHTRLYLYECTKQLDPGEVVIVPTKNTSKAALVQSIFEVIPEEITFDSSKIKSIVSRVDNAVSSDRVRSYLLALVDEYKDGIITKEELYAIMEHLISSAEIEVEDDSELAEIINVQLPDACSYYIDEPGEAEIKELGFWKELKDIEYKLRYG